MSSFVETPSYPQFIFFHSPGSSLGIVSASESMSFIAEAINRAHKDTKGSKVVVVLENMVNPGYLKLPGVLTKERPALEMLLGQISGI